MNCQPNRRRGTRGQAAVEAGLGILVMVTVIVFGIHFAEISYLSIKVPEAAASAMWDATAYRHNRMGASIDMGPRGNAVTNARNSAQNRYGDLDGRTSKTGGTVTQAFTRTSGVTVQCAEDAAAAPLALHAEVNSVLGGGMGGVACRAETTLNLINIGKFHDSGDGNFRVDHVAQGRTDYKICSSGRAWSGSGNGNCGGEMFMLLGDWGLTDGSEAAECVLGTGPCANSGYYEAVNELFSNHGAGSGAAGTALAAAVGLPPMIDENQFFMSFRGEESGFMETVPGSHAGDEGPNYPVTPGAASGYDAADTQKYQTAYQDRQSGSHSEQACWLGLPCNFGT